jgi:hypothetical protein
MPPEQQNSYQPQQVPQSDLAQPQPAEQPALTPIYQMESWYSPSRFTTIFGLRKCLVVVYPGWVVVYKPSDHTEIRRFQLTPDIQMKSLLDYARFSFIEGKKIGLFETSYVFTTPTFGRYIFIVGALLDLVNNATALSSDTGDRNLLFQFVSLGIILIGFGVMAMAIPTNKAFIAACKRGAGIA